MKKPTMGTGGAQTPYPEVSERFVTPLTSPVMTRKGSNSFQYTPDDGLMGVGILKLIFEGLVQNYCYYLILYKKLQ